MSDVCKTCGKPLKNGKFLNCEECRAKRTETMKNYREKDKRPSEKTVLMSEILKFCLLTKCNFCPLQDTSVCKGNVSVQRLRSAVKTINEVLSADGKSLDDLALPELSEQAHDNLYQGIVLRAMDDYRMASEAMANGNNPQTEKMIEDIYHRRFFNLKETDNVLLAKVKREVINFLKSPEVLRHGLDGEMLIREMRKLEGEEVNDE